MDNIDLFIVECVIDISFNYTDICSRTSNIFSFDRLHTTNIINQNKNTLIPSKQLLTNLSTS